MGVELTRSAKKALAALYTHYCQRQAYGQSKQNSTFFMPIPSVAAKTKHEQEQNNDKEPAGAPAVFFVCTACHSGDIAKRHTVIHVENSFHKFL